MLRDIAELDTLLAVDTDHIVAMLVVGSRRFPDGSVKDTNHAVLIVKTAAGEKVVHDPNEPRSPNACRFAKTEDGLTVTWTCRFRDTGEITSQQYFMIETDKFFRAGLAR